MSYVLALDEGTTSARAILFDRTAREVAVHSVPIQCHYPHDGWVEQDAGQIWQAQLSAARSALEKAQISVTEIAAIGITNQRETTIVWDRRTGEAVAPAIVWQCRRTADACRKLVEAGHGPSITAFSNSRMILKQVWVGKGTEVGSELLSRGFRCGDGEGGGGLRGRGKLCRVVLRARKLVELPSPPPIPEASRADRPVSGRCLTTVTGSPPAVFSCVAASAARTRCRSSGVLVAREKRL